jgi:hypothetical protein
VNGQLEWAIEKALKEAGRMPKAGSSNPGGNIGKKKEI